MVVTMSNSVPDSVNSKPDSSSAQPEIVALNRSRHTLNPFQMVGLLAVFLLLSILGGVLTAGLVVPLAAGASVGTKTVTDTFYELPTILDIDQPSQSTKIYASDGKTLLASYYAENRLVVPLEDISPHLQNAVIATEDQRFWSHGGVDIRGTARALVTNVVTDDSSGQGGSTLTQQYVKNVLINKATRENDLAAINAAREGTISRKAREAKLAINVEKSMSKEEILNNYLNIAPFGSKVYGVETAANYYFGKSAKDLSIVEAATIAGITQRPSLYDPSLNPEKNETRRNIVLGLMYQQGYITKAEYDEAIATKVEDTLNLQKLTNGCEGAGRNGFFCDYVTKVIISDPVFGETEEDRLSLLYRGGLEIVTTLDLNQQKIAYDTLRADVPVDNKYGIASALSAIEPGTGKIKAMTQNRDYQAGGGKKDGYTAVNYNTGSAMGGSNGFQSGSTFKVFVLAEWLKKGHTLNETVDATKRTWQEREFNSSCASFGRTPWPPGNSDGLGSGRRSALQATATSINTAYVAMLSQLDLCSVADTAIAVGFKPSVQSADTGVVVRNGIKIIPSMVLGVQETAPLDMANAYATFAAGGVHCNPIAITKVTNREGEELPVPQANCQQVIDTPTANAVTYALTKVVSGSGGAANARLAGGRPAAGKTGTTNDNIAAWFVGYTPQLSTAIWMGNPANSKTKMVNVTINGKYHRRVYGSSIAAPMWKKFMDGALKDEPKTGFPKVSSDKLGRVEVPKPDPAKSDDKKSSSNKDKKNDSKSKDKDKKSESKPGKKPSNDKKKDD